MAVKIMMTKSSACEVLALTFLFLLLGKGLLCEENIVCQVICMFLAASWSSRLLSCLCGNLCKFRYLSMVS